MIDKFVNTFFNKILFRFYVQKKSLKRTLHYCQVFTFTLGFVQLLEIQIWIGGFIFFFLKFIYYIYIIFLQINGFVSRFIYQTTVLMNVLLINSLYFVFHYLFRGRYFFKGLINSLYIFFSLFIQRKIFFKGLGNSHSNLKIEWEK